MKNIMTNNDKNASAQFLRKAVIIFLILALTFFIGFTVLYTVHGVKSITTILYVCILQHIMWLFGVFYFKDILSLDSVIKMYLSFILAIFYPIANIYWESGNPVVFFWYFIIIIGAIVFERRNLGVWIPCTLIIVFSIFFTYPLFPHENFSPQLTFQTNILTIVATIVLASYFAIVLMKQNRYEESAHEETLRTATENAENFERDKELYHNIIEYLEKNKPFKNPDFNAHALAQALNTNVTYISKALSAGGNGNFNMLISNFRINYVKSMLDGGALKKYTIDFIYAEAGYKYRSTFNAAFKSITGMTPSDYVAQNNKDSHS